VKINQSIQIPACSAVLFLATVLQAGASDGASFVSETIPTNTVMAPGQTFTETWTMQNTGTNTWSPGASGYTLTLAGTDSLGAVPLSTNTISKRFHPYATINSGSSVAPGATATFSMNFIAPEAAGTYSDGFQMTSTNGVSFGPQVGVQIIVEQAGPTGQYDRAKAVSYANNYAGFVASDGYFWTNGSDYGDFGALAPVPAVEGDDCAHFVSSCIGSEPHQKGGGLTIPSRVPPTYGEPGAGRLVNTCLIAAGLAAEVFSLSNMCPGDVIAWNWEGNTNIADIDHDTIYLGNGLLAAHSASHLEASATTWYQDEEPEWEWHLIHILNKADTIPPIVTISSPTNWQAFTNVTIATIAVSGTANDAGCPSSGVSLVQAQVNGTNGTWQTVSGTTNWSASASLSPGANTIYARSRDGAGNYSPVASVNVAYTPDTQGATPAITAQPQSQTVVAGQSATFSVGASGGAPLNYQWQFNGNGIPGATASTFTLASAQRTNGGPYSVLVMNAIGTAPSANAMLSFVPLEAWGDDSLGQLDICVGAANAIAVAAGVWHSLALRADGTVAAWGDDSDGQCDVPLTLQPALAIAGGGYHSLALQADGTVAAWGAGDSGQTNVPAGLANVIGISAGTWHSLALRRNGTVAAWGDNSWGQTNVPVGLSNVMAVAAGGSHSLALQTNGTVVAWGDNTDAEGNFVGQSVVPANLTNVVAIAAGEYHSLAVRADGTVAAWGDDSQGQCDVPVGLSNVVAVAGGGGHSVALLADGTVAAWGANWNGQCSLPSDLSDVMGIGAGEYHSLALLAGSIPVPQLLDPARQGCRFSMLAQTLNRMNYALEFNNSVATTNWSALSTNAGNGALEVLTDPTALGQQRFYRLRQW
jgi:hypothetical protein